MPTAHQEVERASARVQIVSHGVQACMERSEARRELKS